LLSGAGHLFNGYTVQGALFAFAFLVGVFAVYLPEGLFRTPYASIPPLAHLIPRLLIFLPLYALSLRSLRRRLNP
jgi:hypothetical protein